MTAPFPGHEGRLLPLHEYPALPRLHRRGRAPERRVAETLLRRPDSGLPALPVVPVTAELVLSAIRLRDRYQLSYWGPDILAATTVFSEDLNHGQIYDGVTVLNPFLPGFTPPEE